MPWTWNPKENKLHFWNEAGKRVGRETVFRNGMKRLRNGVPLTKNQKMLYGMTVAKSGPDGYEGILRTIAGGTKSSRLPFMRNQIYLSIKMAEKEFYRLTGRCLY